MSKDRRAAEHATYQTATRLKNEPGFCLGMVRGNGVPRSPVSGERARALPVKGLIRF